jgi:DNA repair photolyase
VPWRQYTLFGDRTPPTLREIADGNKAEGFEASWPEAAKKADAARYLEVRVRSGLTPTRGMPFNWALNPYRGCTHACEYCYARKYQRHLELDAGDSFSSFILVKRNLPEVLAREVRRLSWTRETVAVGTATDPYQPVEGLQRLTRRCLEVLVEADTPFSVVTKGPMVVRDLDVLRRAATGPGCQVFLSVPSVDERACAELEPGTAPPAQRIRAARLLLDAGIETAILMMPLVPGLTTSPAQVQRTLAAISEAGVPFGGANVARLEPGVREHFLAFLARTHPRLVQGYQRLYGGVSATPAYVRAVKAQVRTIARRVGAAEDD